MAPAVWSPVYRYQKIDDFISIGLIISIAELAKWPVFAKSRRPSTASRPDVNTVRYRLVAPQRFLYWPRWPGHNRLCLVMPVFPVFASAVFFLLLLLHNDGVLVKLRKNASSIPEHRWVPHYVVQVNSFGRAQNKIIINNIKFKALKLARIQFTMYSMNERRKLVRFESLTLNEH